ncbi:helix-turn-helix domain-containing protein [Polymorphospora rubra]|uniref:Transcriptional regulator n=1 Tax=Polymorphospora rubra TaxID=338584 RepID=A0A810NAY7_9ACTN|nr:helix-turn-helix transcriptional regulator [Polymorphospora rubra]BCJ70250.1 transcriptional regulator [Polymorphospora rubra]
MSDNELGDFVRARRGAVTPAEVGLPTGARRRTPGLRRAELATLAGISVEYLVRIEQGRDRRPSASVLAALADALRLSVEERDLLRRAAKAAEGGFCLTPAATPARSVRPTVRAILDRLDPTPAVLLNRLSDVLAHTSGYARLAGPIGVLDAEPGNLARYVFTDPRARATYPHWERIADEQAANLRLNLGRPDPYAARLVDELTAAAGAPFTGRMTGPPVTPQRVGVERLVHPEVGRLRLAYEILEFSETDGQRLVVYLPADEATTVALDRLTGRRPGALRAVTGTPRPVGRATSA